MLLLSEFPYEPSAFGAGLQELIALSAHKSSYQKVGESVQVEAQGRDALSLCGGSTDL